MKRLTTQQLRAIRELVGNVDRGPLRRKTVVDAVGAVGNLRVTVDNMTSEAVGTPIVVIEPRRAAPPFIDGLTAREAEVVEELARGLTNQQIADTLFISVATVKDHIHNVLRKTGFSNRTALIAAYLS